MPSLFDKLKKKSENIAQGVWNQVNPFDGGKTYSNPNPKPNVPQEVQQKVQTAKYGVLANNPQAQNQFLKGIQPTKVNLFANTMTSAANAPVKVGKTIGRPFWESGDAGISGFKALNAKFTGNQKAYNNAATNVTNSLDQSLVGGAKRFGQSVATAAGTPLMNRMLDNQKKYSDNILGKALTTNPLTGAQDNRGNIVKQGGNYYYSGGQSATEDNSLENSYRIRNEALNKSGVNMNDSKGTLVRKIGAQGAGAGLDLAFSGLLGKSLVNAPARQMLKNSVEGGVYGLTGGLSQAAQMDAPTKADYLKSAGLGLAMGTTAPVALGMAGKAGGKATNKVKDSVKPKPIPQELQTKRNNLLVGYNEALAKGNKAAVDFYSKAISQVDKEIKSATSRFGTPLNQGGYVKLPGKGAPIEKTPETVKPLTKKVRTVYETDKQLNGYNKTLKEVIDAEMATDKNYRDVIKEVKGIGGISSSAYEDLPKSVMSKDGTGPSADYAARSLGFDSEDALIEAIQYQKNRPTNTELRNEAIRKLEDGKSLFSGDYKSAKQFVKQREDELSLLPIDAKVTNQKPSALSEAEWNSIAETAPMQATNKKQAVGTELSSVRAELESLNATKAQLNERQRLQVIRGNTQVADAMRKSNVEILQKVKDLKAKERSLARQYAQEAGGERPTGKNMSSAETAQEIFTTKDLKDKKIKQTFMDKTNEYLGGLKSAEVDAQMKARSFTTTHKLSDPQNIEFLKAVNDPTYKTTDMAVRKAVDDAHNIFDKGYVDLTNNGVKMGYQASYFPRIYKHPVTGEPITGPEFNLYTKSARQKGRVADDVNIDNLITKDPAEAIKMYFSSIQKAASGQKYLSNLENDGLVVKSTEPVRGLRPIIAEGMQSPDGMFYYAKKDVANKLNNMFGNKETSNTVEWLAEKGAGLNSAFQSIVLSGGIPNTPVNAFGIMQVMKEGMALHPIKAGKAFYTGMNKNFASKLFTEKADTIKLMADNGLDVRVDLDAIAKSGRQRISETEGMGKTINKAWDEFTNDATFKRFMPALEVMHFENTYKGFMRKGVDPKEAARKATELTKNFYGKNSMAKEVTRSKLSNDVVGATLFAPRFRESMLNFWVKNAEALNPKGGFKNARSGEYNDNLKFMASAALVYATMDGINYSVNGTHMYQNPDGKKDKLLIPYGEKYIGVPFLPSIATVPRNLGMGAFNLATGNLNEFGKNAKSFASMPLRNALDIATNENYFGAPVVEKDSSTLERVGQVGSYLVKNNMQPWVREGMNLAGKNLPDGAKKALGVKDKSALETASNALEAPLRFYSASSMKGGSDNFKLPNNQTLGSQRQDPVKERESIIKAALNTKEAKDFFANTDTKQQELADGNPDLQALYDQRKAMLTGLRPDKVVASKDLTDSEKGAINSWNRLTTEAKNNIAKTNPTRKLAYDLANAKRSLSMGEIDQAAYDKKVASLNKSKVKTASAKKSTKKASSKKVALNVTQAPKPTIANTFVKAPSVKKAVFKGKKTTKRVVKKLKK